MRKLNDRSRPAFLAGNGPDDNEIRDLAYEKWVQNGCQEGREMENWLEAERELREQSLSRTLREQADEAGTVQR